MPITVQVSMSPRVSPSTLGAPLVPLVWYTRFTCSGATHRLAPNGGSSSSAPFNSSFVVKGSALRSARLTNELPTPASRHLRA